MADNGVTLFRLPHFAELPGLGHATSERTGGVSVGPFSSLNLSFGVSDEPSAVLENRRRLASALGVPLERWVLGEQVHGVRVSVVGTADAGRGSTRNAERVAQSDGLVTREPGLALVILTADCVPVLLFDPVRRAIGAAHAGWRGTVAGVASATVRAMQENFGSTPADLRVALGPSIAQADYEVGPEVAEQFETRFLDSRGRLDVAGANAAQLVAAGVRAEHVERAQVSTFAAPERFFSYRRQTKEQPGTHSGIFATAVWLT